MKIVTTIRSRPYVLGCIIGVLILAALLISTSLLSANQYGSLASAIQAAAVIPAIAIAALALTRDSRDKRVDRVLDLHKELHSNDLEEAKARLTAHLRKHGIDGKIRPTSREELRDDPVLSRYDSNSQFSPKADADLLFRFFERADVARLSNSVEAPLLVELIGRAATWWDLAITGVIDEVPRSHLKELAEWSNDFAIDHRHKYSYLQNWGSNRNREFGYIAASPKQ